MAVAASSFPVMTGGNTAALGLLCAWVVPDLRAARGRRYYDGDLLGAAAFAATLLALPLARVGASALAGVTGAAIGLLCGVGLERMDSR